MGGIPKMSGKMWRNWSWTNSRYSHIILEKMLKKQ